MLKNLTCFLRYFIFWLFFFALNRLAFELWNHAKFTDVSLKELLYTYVYGIHMDTSTAGYFSVLPFVVFILCWNFRKITFPRKLILRYTYFLVILTAIITVADFNIYTEWGTKINGRAIDFAVNTPSEAMASSASSPLLPTFLVMAALIAVGIFGIRKILSAPQPKTKKSVAVVPVCLLILGLTFLAIRGGWDVSPMNPSKAYFSTKPILNHSAINTDWLLLSNYFKKPDHHNPYNYITKSENEKIIKKLYPKNDSSDMEILNTSKPNIVLFIMESFTADVVKDLGGEDNVTPAFSSLIKEGILFKNIYATGDRTDKGIVAVLSAFPSQAIKSIIKENDKQEKLPTITEELAANGYHTSFFYGGDAGFANFRSYILAHKFKVLFDKDSLPGEDLTSKWGAYDEVTLKYQLKALNTYKQPFFSTLLTISNHEPFQLPKPGIFPDNSIQNKFRNTSHYASECLLNYINAAKKKPWYKNTLFVFVADHGHRLPKKTNEIFMDGRFHIPLLIIGGALKSDLKGITIDKFGGQTDIVATLLSQLHLSSSKFKYSNNLLSQKSPGFGFYCWDNGFGMVNKNGAVSFDPLSKNIIYKRPENLSEAQKDTTLIRAKAMMQSVYQDYLDK